MGPHDLLPFLYLLQGVYSTASNPTTYNLQQLLDITNTYRSTVASTMQPIQVSNMNKLSWSDRLATEAAGLVTCRSHRNGHRVRISNVLNPSRNFFSNGNLKFFNVGRRRRRERNLRAIVRRWYNERRLWDNEASSCIPWESCPSYINMMNAKRRSMGCAAAYNCGQRNDSMVILCIYEGGNQDVFDFHRGNACTSCPTETPFCENNLCVACDANTQECECTKTCNTPNIGLGTLNPTTCSCNCQYGMGPNCELPCRNSPDAIGVGICANMTRRECDELGMREFCPLECSSNTCRSLPSGLQQLTNQ